MNQPRVYDKVISIQYTPTCNVTNFAFTLTPGQRYYFNGYPALKNVKVKAIACTDSFPITGPTIDSIFLNFVDSKMNQVTNNLPAVDISLSAQPRLRLFDIEGLNMEASYWVSQGINASYANPDIFFTLHFYY
jgi:hypothetical protein